MVFRLLIHNIWFIGSGLEAVLVGVLLLRKTWNKFPFFTSYACFNLFASGLMYAVARTRIGILYFSVYWVCEAIAMLLGLAVVYEIFNSLFSCHEALRKMARTVFRVALILLLLLAVIVLAFQPSMETSIGRIVRVAAEATRIIEVGLLMFLFLFSTAFGLHWRTHVFGIALGLGIFTAVDLVTVTMRSYLGTGAVDILNLARGSAFCLSVLMWSLYLWAPERVSSTGQVPERAQLEQWNQAVMELINR